MATKNKNNSPRALAALGSAAVTTFLLLPVHAAPSATSPLTQPSHDLPSLTKMITALPVTTLDGKALDLAAQSGWKVIYFWSATCPCVRACESFTFIPLSRNIKSTVSFFAVASDGYDLGQPHDWMAHKV